jgi:hypothetical protein
MEKLNPHFFRDMFREDVGDKFSRKSFWGFIIMALVCASYVLDGLDFYTINETLFGYMLIAGTTLIGLKTATKMFMRGNSTK